MQFYKKYSRIITNIEETLVELMHITPINKIQRQFSIKVFLSQRTVQVILALLLYIAFAEHLDAKVHQGIYAFSLFVKDLLKILMPITVAFFVAYTVGHFEKKAPIFVIALVIFEIISNSCATWYGYISGLTISDFLPKLSVKMFDAKFEPLWSMSFHVPEWWSPDKGTIVGISLGIISVFTDMLKLRKVINIGRAIVEFILTKVFSPIVPLFIVGFAAQMHQTNMLQEMFKHYSVVVLFFVAILIIYIIILIIVGVGFNIKNIFKNIRNLTPAGITALISSCSFSTLPITIEGVSKNLNNPELAKGVIPATTNIQLVGDIVMNTFLCFIIYKNFYGTNPHFMEWFIFSVTFVIFRFATSCVLGGVFFLMIPIYEKYLNFSPEMIALLWAFNIILDPIITFGNVVCNGALCKIFENFLAYFNKTKYNLLKNK